MTDKLAIETRLLCRSFGEIKAVKNVSLQVPKKSIFAFLGPNGAGKTTTIRMLLGLIRADSGEVFLNGKNIKTERKQALSKVGSIVETPTLYPNLTGKELLKISSQLLGIGKAEITRVLSWVDLEKDADRQIAKYSLGMRQRLALGRALLGDPELLILDEPTNGLDPSGIVEMREIIKSLPERIDTTILLSSHLLSEIDKMADHCALIDKGHIRYQGEISGLKNSALTKLKIGTTNTSGLRDHLSKNDFNTSLNDGFVLVHGGLSETDLSLLLKSLIQEGFDIYHYQTSMPELEDVFMEMTNEKSGEQ